ncbi:3006_t:CDS:2 [Ambispora gerdemannii]|uniref:3006_t:CDS:1 n=1 Tax=Ambispora gerdemannii TaxID=144530 RepID=A0A9N8ZC31_9GLOM|nr:3006_t:CDS:2 [Ambispora gerdemannii]
MKPRSQLTNNSFNNYDANSPQPGPDEIISDKWIVKQYYKAPSPSDFKDLKRKCSPFFLFRRKVNEAIQKSGRVRSAGRISKLAAELWKETPPNEKEIYNLFAEVGCRSL